MNNLNRILKLSVLTVVVLGWVAVAHAFSSGPPLAHTGAPGEQTCIECHGSFSINSGGGSVAITGLPDSYTPGTKYSLTVTVSQNGRRRWGFQTTALADDGSFVGSFTSTNGAFTQIRNQSVSGKVRTYINHTSSGTQNGTQNTASFRFDWTAPATAVGQVTFYVCGNAANGDGSSGGDNIYTTTARVAGPAVATPPSVTSLNPNKGPTAGGTTVTITGANFASGATTTFDGLAAQTTFVDARTLRVVTPARGAGAVDVVVKNSDGLTGTARGAFTYEAAQAPPPAPTSINPNKGPVAGGTDVTIAGTNFAQGATVLIGGRDAVVSSVSATEIKAKTPPANPGAADVVVKNADGQQAVLGGAFVYEGAPQGSSIAVTAPNGGETLSSGGVAFRIAWTSVAGAGATIDIDLSTDGGLNFGTSVAKGLSAADTTSFLFAVPSGVQTERARIRCRLTDGAATVSDVSDADFKILPAPVVSSISPSTSTAGGQIAKLKVTGSGFQSGAVIEVNGTAVTTKFKSATSLQAKKVNTPTAGTLKVRVRNPDGTISLERDLVVR